MHPSLKSLICSQKVYQESLRTKRLLLTLKPVNPYLQKKRHEGNGSVFGVLLETYLDKHCPERRVVRRERRLSRKKKVTVSKAALYVNSYLGIDHEGKTGLHHL